MNVKVITGGQNGYNGGGSGYYNGGGYTSVVYNGQEIMIAAGGGGGGSGTAGGNGDSKGGTSSGGSGKYNGGGASGSDGQNGYGGGGSGYNYTYATTYNDCKYGHNTCTGGTIKTNCSSCYRTECVGGYEQTDCDNCSSTKTVCVGGYDEKCKTCIKETKTCGANQHFGYTASNSNVCYYNDLNVRGSCECKNGLTYGSCTDVGCYGESGYERDRTLDSYAGYKSYSEACKNIKNGKITVTGVCYFSANWLGFDPIVTKSEITSCTECGTEQVYNSCKSTKQECVSSCKETYNSCLTKRCVSDCDTVYNSCAYGENTCQGGWNYATKYYNSGHGGSNLLNKDLINPKSENGTRSGNGFVTISYYGEKI